MRGALAIAAIALVGCAVRIPEGRFACGTRDECPSGWSCSAGFCVSESAGEAGLDAFGIDAGSQDAEAADSGSFDAGPLDAGSMDVGSFDGGSPRDSEASDGETDRGDSSAPDAGVCATIGATPSLSPLIAFSSTGEDDVPALGFAGGAVPLFVPLQFSGSGLVVEGAPYASTGALDGLALRMTSDGAVSRATPYTGTAGGAPFEAIPLGADMVTAGHFVTAIEFDGFAPAGSARRSSFVYREGRTPRTLSSTSGSVMAESLAVRGDRICIGGQITGDTDFGGGVVTVRGDDGFVACYTGELAYVDSFGFGGVGSLDRVNDLAFGPDGALYVVGRFAASAGTSFRSDIITSNGLEDGFVARLAPDGSVDWIRNISTPDTTRDESATAIAVDADGVYVGGYLGAGTITGLGTSESFGTTVAYWARFEPTTGAVVWSRFEDTSSGDVTYAIATDGCGHVYVGGGVDSVSPLGPTNVIPFLIALDDAGTERWRLVASGGRGSVHGLAADAEGRVYAAGPYTGTLSIGGATTGASRGVSDAFLAIITQ